MTDEREVVLRCFRDCPVKTVEDACDSCEIYEIAPSFKYFQEKREWHQKEAKFIRDYIRPIFTLQFGKILKNYKLNCEESARKADRKAFREEMMEAGVYDSLRELQTQGTQWDKIQAELRGLNHKVPGTVSVATSHYLDGPRTVFTGPTFYDDYGLSNRKLGHFEGQYYDPQLEKIVRDIWKVSEERHDGPDKPIGSAAAA